MTLHLLPIRHHGPGSARSVLAALDALAPATLLVEGPPDADPLIPFLADQGTVPPVAVLAHVHLSPEQSVFYPLAEFSPEWVAIRWALERGVPVGFMDLPAAVTLAQEPSPLAARDPLPEVEGEKSSLQGEREGEAQLREGDLQSCEAEGLVQDPLALLAQAAGYSDFERWWDALVESRGEGIFDAVNEVMAALREEDAGHTSERDLLREAQMREIIRTALKKGDVAVVCGAWHAPALTSEALEREKKADPARLKGLPKVKTSLTVTPWTHGRLTQASGYGAGITSPGWYAHLFRTPQHVSESWLTRSARLLREKGLDASSAQVIDATRLADALAALRGRSLAGLDELTDATQAVFAWDSDTPLRLLSEQLFVGEVLGSVPAEVPAVPLAQDLAATLKTLRLKQEATTREVTLDLREDAGLNKSHLFHRLNVLGIPWARESHARGTGTFKEEWTLRWEPEYAVRLIEASRYGNTLVRAANAAAVSRARRADLAELSRLLEVTRLANLPDAARFALAKLDERAASADTAALLDALPPLARLARYGDVRSREGDDPRPVFRTLTARAAAGLPNAAHALKDDAAQDLQKQLAEADRAVRLLDDAEATAEWVLALHALDAEGTAPLLRGDAVARLRDRQLLDEDTVRGRLGAALAPGQDVPTVAAWLDGFLGEGGVTLLHDSAALGLLDDWVVALDEEQFGEVLPALRRSLSRISPPERRRLGEDLRGLERETASAEVNDELGMLAVATGLRLLGVGDAK
ncbi:DUF5682 family protein [Deinococcus wulumuqiensis]|uniref:BREX-2 system phosphatase PglZ n=1 Tax=Deinococcus wulumuqiensis TaxID=980427 RepID=A0AAV4KB90_9DEIO|nr:DUF5682 family protein [Deinococcus wulumuqiensis]QII19989.1 hypothetical protein G6R31_03875 [Deinococcus wulumuqiensis R12]GGI67900.1 hypothetical protein GCM10008021_30160 [Deinococcus wulumuqiensis]GGI94145.1 hypothetical protein GCM10010914_30940 [Deinococcus wulumuqiensis]